MKTSSLDEALAALEQQVRNEDSDSSTASFVVLAQQLREALSVSNEEELNTIRIIAIAVTDDLINDKIKKIESNE